MIPKNDSKPFKIKFPIGISKTNKVDMKYQDEWQTVYGLVGEPNGAISKYVYGIDTPFDKIIVVNACEITRAINENTLFIIDNIPTSTYQKGDYSVKRILPEKNGEIVIALSKKEAINIPKLYFKNGNEILYYQINFDKTHLKAYSSVNSFLPFKEGDYVWTRDPSNVDDVNHRLKLISKSKTGLGSNFKPFIELSFVEE